MWVVPLPGVKCGGPQSAGWAGEAAGARKESPRSARTPGGPSCSCLPRPGGSRRPQGRAGSGRGWAGGPVPSTSGLWAPPRAAAGCRAGCSGPNRRPIRGAVREAPARAPLPGERRLSFTSSRPGRPSGSVPVSLGSRRVHGLGVGGPAGAAARLAVVPVAAQVHLDGQGAVGARLVLAAVVWGRGMGSRGAGHQEGPTTLPAPPAPAKGGGVHRAALVTEHRWTGGPSVPLPGSGASGLLPAHSGHPGSRSRPPQCCPPSQDRHGSPQAVRPVPGGGRVMRRGQGLEVSLTSPPKDPWEAPSA